MSQLEYKTVIIPYITGRSLWQCQNKVSYIGKRCFSAFRQIHSSYWSMKNADCVSARDKSSTSMIKKSLHDVVFVLGPPGSGKGTQCINIEQEFGFVHLIEITCKLLENAMIAKNDAVGYLIDGFPRNWNNVNGWQKEMSSKVKLHFVLYLNVPVDVCLERCLNRGQNRTDDNTESMAKRITTYNSQTLPIIQYYSSLKLVREIDGSRNANKVLQSVEEIFEDEGFEAADGKKKIFEKKENNQSNSYLSNTCRVN
uniref:Adenylate kinase n=1 Tax=Ditylenchus dipsaci TaxID=166011 RepID=A0A915ES86_9BILA